MPMTRKNEKKKEVASISWISEDDMPTDMLASLDNITLLPQNRIGPAGLHTIYDQSKIKVPVIYQDASSPLTRDKKGKNALRYN